MASCRPRLRRRSAAAMTAPSDGGGRPKPSPRRRARCSARCRRCPAHVKLEQRRALAGANFQQAFQLVVDSGERRSEPYPITAVMAACIGQMNGRTSLGDIVSAVNRQHNLRDEQGLRQIMERDLPPLINAGLIDVTTRAVGRNDPLPLRLRQEVQALPRPLSFDLDQATPCGTFVPGRYRSTS